MSLSRTVAFLAKQSSRRGIKAEYLAIKAISGNRPTETISVRYTKLKEAWKFKDSCY
jgi:hypothetical protein